MSSRASATEVTHVAWASRSRWWQPADAAEQDVVDINACGLQLRSQYRFPDAQCPDESPMAELDGEILDIPAIATLPEAPAMDDGEAAENDKAPR